MDTAGLITTLGWLARKPRTCLRPGWKLGHGESRRTARGRFEHWLWERLTSPATIPWLNSTRVYAYPECELSRALFLTGLFEPNEMFWLDRVLGRGMVFVDVGANMGLYTLFAARKVGPTGAVVAIEPSSREFARLEAHVRLNKLANVRLLQVAVSDSPRKADLLVATEEKSGHNTLGSFGYDSVVAQGMERVCVERLDDIVQRIGVPRVDIIKMDIEGAEFLALQGAKETLSRYRPIILMELSDRTLKHQGCHSGQILELLSQEGYRVYRFDEATGLPISAVRKTWFDAENIIAIHKSVGRDVL